jgi:hypothetical protein
MNTPLQALAGKRIPEIDRVPQLLPVGGNWFTIAYNPTDDTTYRVELKEFPYLQATDAFRVVSRPVFATEWSKSQMRAGRYSRITNRVGTRPTSDILVQELGGKKLGLALELYPDDTAPSGLGEVRLVSYNPVGDTINEIGLGGNGSTTLYYDITLNAAKAAIVANPAQVIPGALYGIAGVWNGATTASTIYLHGVKSNAFNSLGITYSAQGAPTVVYVNVSAGTYTAALLTADQKASIPDGVSASNKLVASDDTRLQDLARGFIDYQNEAQLYEEDVTANANAVFGGIFTGKFATMTTGKAFAFDKHSGSPVDMIVKLPSPGYVGNSYVLSFRIAPGVTLIKSITIIGPNNENIGKITGKNQTLVIRGQYGGWSILINPVDIAVIIASLGAATPQNPAATLSDVAAVLSEPLTLAQAQAKITAGTLIPGRNYIVNFGDDGNGIFNTVYSIALSTTLLNRFVTVISRNGINGPAIISQMLAGFRGTGTLDEIAGNGGGSPFDPTAINDRLDEIDQILADASPGDKAAPYSYINDTLQKTVYPFQIVNFQKETPISAISPVDVLYDYSSLLLNGGGVADCICGSQWLIGIRVPVDGVATSIRFNAATIDAPDWDTMTIDGVKGPFTLQPGETWFIGVKDKIQSDFQFQSYLKSGGQPASPGNPNPGTGLTFPSPSMRLQIVALQYDVDGFNISPMPQGVGPFLPFTDRTTRAQYSYSSDLDGNSVLVKIQIG